MTTPEVLGLDPLDPKILEAATSKRLPTDMLMDPKGRWVPKSIIKDIDLQEDELVNEIANAAEKTAQILSDSKRRMIEDVRAFLSLSAEKYGVKLEGEKGNVTLSSYDGAKRVQISVADRVAFDHRVQAAKALVDECLKEWTQGSRDEVRMLVTEAFQVDAKGKINVERVLHLRRLDFKDEKWQRAMQAINDSIITESTATYLRIYKKGPDGKHRAIELDWSKVQ